MNVPAWAVRSALVTGGLGGWFWTQALISRRGFPEGRIGDRVLEWTSPLNLYLRVHPRTADVLLILTSAAIDVLGVFVLWQSIFGPSIRPLLGLLLLYASRQVCQGLCALPCPEGMIWRHPGFPTLFVTYGTASDLFFSGHTAIAVYASLELARWGGPLWAGVGLALAVVEASTVLVLRAHYTMDVFAGAVTALWAAGAAGALAPHVDTFIRGIAG